MLYEHLLQRFLELLAGIQRFHNKLWHMQRGFWGSFQIDSCHKVIPKTQTDVDNARITVPNIIDLGQLRYREKCVCLIHRPPPPLSSQGVEIKAQEFWFLNVALKTQRELPPEFRSSPRKCGGDCSFNQHTTKPKINRDSVLLKTFFLFLIISFLPTPGQDIFFPVAKVR